MQGTEDGRSLSQRIRVSLMDDISTGNIAPGTVLDEIQLAAQFSASRTPVREALKQLESSGLIEIRPRKGAVVLPLTLPKLMEMFEVTAEMEAMCVRLATHRITGDERALLWEIHDAAALAVTHKDLDLYDESNLRFHDQLYSSAHNAFLFEELLRLRSRLMPFRRTQLRHEERLEKSHSEHAEILRAIMRGDGDEAARVMREHMLNAAVTLARFMSAGLRSGEPTDL